jgi:hypothetical protein
MSGLNMGDALIALGSVTTLTVGDKLTLQLPCPFRVYGWGYYINTTALDATPNALLAALDRNVINGATRTNAVGGKTLSMAIDRALGSVLEVVPTSALDFAVGEQAIVEVTQEPSAGAGVAFIVYRPQTLALGNALRFDASI